MKKLLTTLIDIFTIPLTFISGVWLKFVRKRLVGFWHSNAPLTRLVLQRIGMFPIINHYYDPFISPSKFKKPLHENRTLIGINLRKDEQLSLLKKFDYRNELLEISTLPKNKLTYSFDNGPFLSGDSEMLFNIVRYFKPQRVIEIGCGHSSLMIQEALTYNQKENDKYFCEHTCVEPFENSWLSKLKVKVVKEKVEDMDLIFFQNLEENDILFIDSTHMIRPQGDVLFEYLELLPTLKSGVIIHIHDIFTPRDYLDEWFRDGMLFWNEQYLLEAFLTFNSEFEVICGVNFLKNNHFDEILLKCPMLTREREPGSFWIRRK